MSRKWLFVLFFLALVLFVSLSAKSGFHDSPEYYNLAQTFAGEGSQAAFSSHSFVYSFLVSLFLPLGSVVLVAKLFNVFFICAAFLLLAWYKREALWLFALSPLLWLVSIDFTPAVPAMFFLLGVYVFYKKWSEQRYVWKYFVFSALCAGGAFAFYTPALIPLFFFGLVFLWRERFGVVLLYGLFSLPLVLFRFVLDYVYSGLWGYTLIRYIGVNLKILLGQYPTQHGSVMGLYTPELWLVFFLICPLFFFIYRVDLKRYKQELLFLALCFLVFLVRGGLYKYFLMFSPIFLLLLSLSFKEKVFSTVVSIVLIVLVCFPFFMATTDSLAANDLSLIHADYEFDRAVLSPRFTYLDSSDAYYVWPEEYVLAASGESVFSGLTIASEPRVDLYKGFVLTGDLVRRSGDSYGDIQYWIDSAVTSEPAPENFVLDRCYSHLCVYAKSSSSS